MTHEQIALVINNYFKFDTATGKLASQRQQFCFCMYTYKHHLENLSYQTHTKLWALKSSFKGTFLTKRLYETIVACGVLRVNRQQRILCMKYVYADSIFNWLHFVFRTDSNNLWKIAEARWNELENTEVV